MSTSPTCSSWSTFYWNRGAERFELEAGDLEARLKAMPELSERERSLLRSEAGAADQYFYSYFRRSRLLYLVLAGAGALYLLLLFTPLATHLPLVTAPYPQCRSSRRESSLAYLRRQSTRAILLPAWGCSSVGRAQRSQC